MIVKLKVDSRYLPEWFDPRYPTHVPLPDEGALQLDGEVIAWGKIDDREIPLISLSSGAVQLRYEWSSWRAFILLERYRDVNRPLFTRLPFHYHRVPGLLRNAAAKLVFSRRGSSELPRKQFPGFPIEQGFELLNDVVLRFAEPHLDTAFPPRIILTHDIDTAAGFEWVRRTTQLESDYGFKSLWHVVGRGYKIAYKVLDHLIESGFEIGLHGYNHDNKLAFLSETQIRRRLDRCGELIETYDISSFRSPSWFRNEKLFGVLGDYFQKDFSSPDSDICCPGGVGGCLYTKPFTFNDLTHVPTTMPFEVPLFFGYEPQQLVEFWRPKIDWLAACGGHIVVNTHPDPHYSGNQEMLTAYEGLLRELAKFRDRPVSRELPSADGVLQGL